MTPMVTLVVQIVPDGEVKFGPAPMRKLGDSTWRIPGLTWEPDCTLTMAGCYAEITMPDGETTRVDVPNSFGGRVVTAGDTVRIEFDNSVFSIDTRVH